MFEHRGCVDGFLRDVVVSRWRRKEASEDEPLTVRLLMYLAGFPQHGSPFCFLPPILALTRNPLTSKLSGLHPSLEGRGQVATCSDMEGPK